MSKKRPIFSVSIHDCEIQTFKAGGKGGQRKDNTETAVRIIHRPSGAVGLSREDRLQISNKRKAFERMAKSDAFQKWVRTQAMRYFNRETVAERLDRMMADRNIKVEVKDEEGKWIVQ
jgi:protein subunit release factor A